VEIAAKYPRAEIPKNSKKCFKDPLNIRFIIIIVIIIILFHSKRKMRGFFSDSSECLLEEFGEKRLKIVEIFREPNI